MKYSRQKTEYGVLKRVCSFLLALIMMCSPITAFADSDSHDGQMICGLTEHTHGENCYETVLVCEDADEEHEHDESCYSTILVCGMEEHTHTDACIAAKQDQESKDAAGTEQANADDQSVSAQDGDVIGEEGSAEGRSAATAAAHEPEDTTQQTDGQAVQDLTVIESEDEDGEFSVIMPEVEEGVEDEGEAQEGAVFGTLSATDDRTYSVTVYFSEEACMPDDADLVVRELIGDEYDEYLSMTADAMSAEEFTFARIFDITIVDGEENEIQPEAPVQVAIEVWDEIFEDADLSVLHFAEGEEAPLEMSAETDGNTVSFETDGFSVYSIVAAPAPYSTSNIISVPTAQEFSENYDDETGFFIYYGANKYMRNTMNGNSAFVETTNLADAAQWFFEAVPGTPGQYYIYTIVNGATKYIKHKSGNLLELSDTAVTPFIVTQADTGKFYIGLVDGTRWLQHSGSGSGMRLWTDHNNATNSQLVLAYASSTIMPNDPYDLDGKTYGLANHRSSTTAAAVMSTTKSAKITVGGSAQTRVQLTDMTTMVRNDQMSDDGLLLVAQDSEITMWTFHSVEKDFYYISTVKNGSVKYLGVSGNDMVFVDTPDDSCKFRVTPGIGANAGKITLSQGNSVLTYVTSTKTFTMLSNGSASAQYLSFCEPSVYTDEDFVSYQAKKISVSDIQNGDNVVIYERIWNSSTNQYEFYIVDWNGRLLRAYESGDEIIWVGTRINTAPWEFTEYYYAGTTDPNYYYDLQNVYSGEYIAPQMMNSQMFSDEPFGVNLNGRRYGDYYSEILAWDDPYYDYAGLAASDGRVSPVPMSQADQFYFAVVETADILHPIETVDHTQHGVTMKIVDFNGNSGQNAFLNDTTGTHGQSSLKGLLQTQLGSDGYPLNQNGDSMSTLYAGAEEVNHIFLSSTYYGSGYYEFDSTKEFASLSSETDEHGNKIFTVYQELGTVDYVHGNTIKHGQFMPYNTITAGEFCEINPYNLYDALGNELDGNDPRKGERLYKIPAENANDPNAANFYFGVQIEAEFIQTENGEDSWGHDIIFEFTGDDDFWLYVDDELVLDLGGIHSALPGSVNFKTGVVVCRGENNKNVTTSLYDIFRENYVARGYSAAEIEERLDSIFREKVINGVTRHVFKDYSAHKMSIFFMERGAGASNLRMRFNLEPAVPGQVKLSKTVSGTDKQDYSSVKFPFQIFYKIGQTEYQIIPDATGTRPFPVTTLNTSQNVDYEETYTTADTTYSHVFLLKPGQTAVFDVPEEASEYWVKECGVKTNIYDSVQVNGEAIPVANITSHANTNDYESTREAVSDRARVIFDNHVNQSNLRTLTVTKKLFDASGQELSAAEDPTGFRFRMRIGENLEYYRLGEYHVKDENNYYCTYANGTGFVSTGVAAFGQLTAAQKTAATFKTSPSGAIDKIPAGYSVEIRDLMVGTRFMVTEDSYEIPLGYGMRTWTETVGGITTSYTGYKRVEGSYIVEPGMGPNEGVIRENNDPSVEIHNQRGWGIRANKSWSDEDYMLSHGDIYFAVFVGNSSTPLPGTVRKIDSYNYTTYYFGALESGSTFADYHVYEVALTNPHVDSGGNITYDAITKMRAEDNNNQFQLSGGVLTDGTDAGALTYRVSYAPGTATGSASGLSNIRTDTIRNTRIGGLEIYKTAMNGTTGLGGAVFELSENDIPLSSYTSDQTGLVTTLYLDDGTYALAETKAPRQYQSSPITLTITASNGAYTVTGADGSMVIYDAQNARVTFKNKPFTLAAMKVDAGAQNAPLAGAHFALYRQIQGYKEYYPYAGYEDLVSDASGYISGINGTLPPGTYYLTETQAPSGYYDLGKDVCFTIGNDGVVSVMSGQNFTGSLTQSGSSTTAYTIVIENSRRPQVVVPTGVGVGCPERTAFALVATIAVSGLLRCRMTGKKKNGEF